MAEIEGYILVLFKFLTASLIIERLLEYLEKVLDLVGFASGNKTLLLKFSVKSEITDLQSERNRVLNKMLIVQTVGFIAGIVVCTMSKLGIAQELGFVSAIPGQTPRWWDLWLSGALISGGSEPIHNLINFLKDKRNQLILENEDKEKEIVKPSFPKIVEKKTPVQQIGVDYQGGLYPNKPGHGLRKANPKYIVVHHTASHETWSFEDVVRTEQQQNLDPSYHCVVTFDGTCHNYCRWDSVGWHAKRGTTISNSNSLGICFVGNFEDRPDVPGYNDWQENPLPSPAQLDTAAVVIALWMYLYEIKPADVVGHRDVKKKYTVCPGNNFPMDQLLEMSNQKFEQWMKDEALLAQLESFKQKKYIYV